MVPTMPASVRPVRLGTADARGSACLTTGAKMRIRRFATVQRGKLQVVGSATLDSTSQAARGAPAAYHPEPWPSASAPCEEASVPPPSWYTEKGFASLEEERVFKRHWVYAGPVDKLREPGDYFTGMRNGLGFVVCMDEARKVRAYHNVCSHRAAAVAMGEGRATIVGDEGPRFECPYHGWRFDMEGRFRGCKVSNGLQGIKNFAPDTSSLQEIPCDTWGPLVFLHWGENELAPIAQVMGDGGKLLESEGLRSGEWRFYKRVEYPMACNWKCMVDNYQDGNYHVYLCHPGLIGCYRMDDSHNKLFDYVTSMWGPNEAPEKWPADGQPGGKYAHHMVTRTHGGETQSYNMVYPNMFFNRYGSWMSVTQVTPVGESDCLTTFDLFFKEEQLSDAEWLAKCSAAEDELQNQDIELCLRVGANLSNPLYNAGRYAPIETPMWWFHQRLHEDIFGSAPGLVHKPPGANRWHVTGAPLADIIRGKRA